MKFGRLRLLISCFLLISILHGKSQEISFRHLTVNDGLSNNSVICLYQDEKGFIWTGTRNGVNRYNGTEFMIYKFQKDNPNSIIFNNILKITGNGQNEIYFMTPKGVSSFDTATERFSTLIQGNIRSMYYHNGLYVSKENQLLRHNGSKFEMYYHLKDSSAHITSIYVCDEYTLIGTERQGLFKLDRQSKNITPLITDVYVNCIFKDRTGKLWIGTWEDGIYIIDKESIRNFKHTEQHTGSISSNFIRSFCEDKLGNIWIGTFNGLNRYNTATQTFTHYQEDEKEQSLTHSSIWSLLCDQQGTIWIGTYFGGLNYFNPQHQIYHFYQTSKKEDEGLSSSIVGRILEDKQHRLWIGTEGGGINIFDPQTKTFRWLKHRPTGNSLSQDNVKALYYDAAKDVVWIGTHLGGLNKYDIRSGHFTYYLHEKNDPQSLPSNTVRDIVAYQDQLILGTHAGVCMFNPANGKSKPLFQQEPFKINFASTLCIDHRGTLWATGNGKGVYRYRFDTQTTQHYQHNSDSTHSLSSNSVNRIYEDSQRRLWFCTHESGIDLYRPESDDFENFDEQQNGLASNCVYDVCEISSDRLLFITDIGFSILDYHTQTFTNYSEENGFPLSATNERSLYKANNGDIFIGGMNGMVSFSPKDIDRPLQQYEIHPFRLIVNGKDIQVNDDTHILTQALPYTSQLTLKHTQRMFSIEYAIIDYAPFNKDDIEYFLKGFSKEWTSTRGRNVITYTNLNPGKYTLTVRAKDNPLVPESRIDIEILPPFYQTPIAYLFYIICIGILLYYSIRAYNNHIKLQESLKYEQKRAEDIKQMNQAKLRFFTNISHEFRTPLTLIIGQMEMLLQARSFAPTIYSKILGVYKNSLQLRELITELLDFRKQEQGYMTIKVNEQNLVDFVYEHYLLFQEYAIQRNISFCFHKSHDNLPVWYDAKQMRKVFNNLISNAFKHTKEGGKISISIRKGNKEVIIEVTDNGTGIATQDLPRIFERFYQSDRIESLTHPGTGIGLSLTKGIIELHHGTIEVFSEPNEETTFSVHLKTGKEHFSPEQIGNPHEEILTDNMKDDYHPELMLVDEEEVILGKNTVGSNTGAKKEVKILIVEDNHSLREMLVKLFQKFYTIIEAENGREGWEKAQKEQPDIILSDVVMPEMSGIELCQRVKKEMDTCHIPVVLLTARTAVEHNIEGLNIGADDYITKPFNINILLSRCNNLVNNRILLQEKFSNQPQTTTKILVSNPIDRELTDKIMNVIEQHIDDVEFNIDTLAREVGIARTKLFTKLKNITGQTPYDFIVTVRLKRAALMLKEHPELNVSEISDRLGFSSPRQFSKCFKDKYQMVPQAYRKGDSVCK